MTATGASEWTWFGRADAMQLGVRWARHDVPTTGTADEATAGHLCLRVAERTIWGGSLGDHDAGVEWTWIDWVEHLARSWARLQWEQRDPLGLDVELPFLLSKAGERWRSEEDPARRDAEQRRVWGFLEAHDLAAGLGGIALPSVFVLRQGRLARIATDTEVFTLPLDGMLACLAAFASHACDRLAKLTQDGRAAAARAAWKKRNSYAQDPAVFIRLVTGLEPSALTALVGRQAPDHFFELTEVRNDNELLAVARMTVGTIPAKDIGALIGKMRKVGPRPAAIANLDVLAKKALAAMPEDEVTHAQGRAVARWLRAELKSGTAPVEPRELLASWNVDVQEVELATPLLEAVSVWGPERGPTVFVNLAAMRSSTEQGRRATLAHEIAHLLLDRHGALPLAEVLGGGAPQGPESRANAFAAELLLPREVAGEAFRKSQTDDDAKAALRRLRRKYGSSFEIIAWQALRSTVELQPPVRSVLIAELPADRRYQVNF